MPMLTVSGGQLRSYKQGKSFQLSRDQLQGMPKKGKMHEIEIDENHVKGINSAARRGKGYRIKGDGIMKSTGKKLGVSKSVGHGFGKALKKVGKAAGQAAEVAKDLIPESYVQKQMEQQLIAQGVDPSTAAIMSKSSTAAAYGVDLSKGDAASNALTAGMAAGKAGVKEVKKQKKSKSVNGQGIMKSLKNATKSVKKGVSSVKDVAYDINLGKNLEAVKDAIPQSLVENTMKTALMAQGMSPEEADAVAASGTAAVYGYSFDEKASKKNVGNALSDGAQAGLQSVLTSALVGQGVKGRNHIACDSCKNPKRMHGGAVFRSSVMKSNAPIFSPLTNTSRIKNTLVKDSNTSVGGSMVALNRGGSMVALSTGGSFKPIGGSFRPLGEGLKQKQSKKGSPEMIERMAKLRALKRK